MYMVLQIMESFINLTRSRDRLLTHPELTRLLPGLANATPLDAGAVVSSKKSISALRTACDAAVASSTRNLVKKATELDALRPLREFAATFDAQAYKDASRSVAQFRADMLLLRCGLLAPLRSCFPFLIMLEIHLRRLLV